MESCTVPSDIQGRARYAEKVRVVGDLDPYKIRDKDWNSDLNVLPDITYIDLVNYLIFHPSPFCELKDFENYKSMEAYDRFVSGWVRDVRVYVFEDARRKL